MIGDDDSKYLLFMEPKASEKSKEPIEDEWVELAERAIGDAEEGIRCRGFHVTACGAVSKNHDWILQNGMITNSLAPFYLRWYRDSVSVFDFVKLYSLWMYYRRNDGTECIQKSP